MPPPLRSADVLADFQSDVARIQSTVQDSWAPHAPAHLAERPAPRKWSALDCLEHTRRANKLYMRPLTKAIERCEAKGVRADEHFEPGSVGLRMRAQLRPQPGPPATDGRARVKFKLPTVGKADPTKDATPPVQEVTLDAFDAQMEQLRALGQRAERVDLNARVTGFFGNVLRLRIGDVLRYLIAHTDRHLVQAERAIARAQQGGGEAERAD